MSQSLCNNANKLADTLFILNIKEKSVQDVAKGNRASVFFDREKRAFVGLDADSKKQLTDTYKGVDVDAELSKMGLWLLSQKGAKRKGNLGFIINWLNNASPKAPSIVEQLNMLEIDTPLGQLYLDYRKGLWKGREHILEFNTIKH